MDYAKYIVYLIDEIAKNLYKVPYHYRIENALNFINLVITFLSNIK